MSDSHDNEIVRGGIHFNADRDLLTRSAMIAKVREVYELLHTLVAERDALALERDQVAAQRDGIAEICRQQFDLATKILARCDSLADELEALRSRLNNP